MAGFAAAALATTMALPAANAAPEPVSTPVTGELNLNGNANALSTVVFEGTYDPDTGELVGKLIFPAGEIVKEDALPGVTATITHQVTQPDPGTGMVDLDTGDATFSADLVLSLLTLALNDGDPADLAPCSYTIPLDLTGTFDFDTSIITLAQSGFPIAQNPADGDPRCAGLGDIIDEQIVGEQNAVTAAMDLTVTDATAPEPAEPPAAPPAEPPAAPAPAAQAVQQDPNFTG